MPIQYYNYTAAPPQGDPMLDAIVPGVAQGLKLAYMPKQLDADLKSQQLKQALQQIQLKYAEPKAQSDLDYKKALTGLTQQRSQFMPIDELTRAMNSQRANSRFGQAYQLSRMLSNLSPAARATWIDANKEAYTAAINTMANEQAQPQDNSQALLQQLLEKTFGAQQPGGNPGAQQPAMPSIDPLKTQLSPEDIQNLVKSGIAKPMQTSGFMTSPEQLDKIGLASEMEANKDLTTPATRRQGEASASFDKFLIDNQKDYGQAVQNISKYAGLIGKGKLGLDKLAAENPQALQDYQWFTDSFVPGLGNMTTQLEGASIAPSKQKEIKNTFESGVKSLGTDPKASINYFNRVIEMLSQISKSRVNTAQPIFKDTFKKAYGYEGIPKPYVAAGASKTTVRLSNGKTVSGSQSQIDALLRDHPELRSDQ